MNDTYAISVYLANIKALLEKISSAPNNPSKQMEFIEMLEKETQALRFHVWHSYHTSGAPQ